MDEVNVKDSFPDEGIFAVDNGAWYVNYLVYNVLSPELIHHQRKKSFSKWKYYHWKDPILYRKVLIRSFKDVIQMRTSLGF